jgi:hypothetical protein
LFALVLLVAAGFTVLVVVAPWLDNGGARPHGLHKVTAVFARDGTLRRTTLASAVGLTVAAFVFFRPTAGNSLLPRGPSRPTPPPMVGA